MELHARGLPWTAATIGPPWSTVAATTARLGREAVGEVHVGALRTVESSLGRVAASVFQPMCGTRGARTRRTPPLQQSEPLTALLALPEEGAASRRDSRDGSAVRDALAQGLVEGVPGQAGGGALDVADPCDQRQRRLPDDVGIGRDDRLDARAGERGESERRFPAP